MFLVLLTNLSEVIVRAERVRRRIGVHLAPGLAVAARLGDQGVPLALALEQRWRLVAVREHWRAFVSGLPGAGEIFWGQPLNLAVCVRAVPAPVTMGAASGQILDTSA
eukprot:SAG31_NODE_783_length_12123_cov_5.272130_3_plen_108_part_00